MLGDLLLSIREEKCVGMHSLIREGRCGGPSFKEIYQIHIHLSKIDQEESLPHLHTEYGIWDRLLWTFYNYFSPPIFKVYGA